MKKVTAAILVKNGYILIAKRNAQGDAANKWEFPGGKIEGGETPEDCLKREMKEEFNILVSVGKFFDESIYSYKNGTIQLLAYWTQWHSGNITPNVHAEYKWVAPNELINYDFAPADIPLVKKLRSGNLEFLP